MGVFGTRQPAQTAEDFAAAERLRVIANRYKVERSPDPADSQPRSVDEREDERP
jgi:hypothetical protein